MATSGTEQGTVKSPYRILIIDDQPLERRLLEVRLQKAGLSTISASSGAHGLQLAKEKKPDVILLDVMMEEENGFEACQCFKDEPATADIPILFITSVSSREKILQGLNMGAADYLTKPVDGEALVARVRTHARMHRQHLQNLKLSQELEAARRKEEIMHITEGIAHNLNNALGVIFGYLTLAKAFHDDPERVKRNCTQIDTAVQRMAKMVKQLTVVGQFRSVHLQSVQLSDILNGAVARYQRNNSDALSVDVQSALPAEYGLSTNREIVESCLEQLLLNAQQSYGKEFSGKKLRLTANLEDSGSQQLLLSVWDTGCGVPPELASSIYDPFVSSHAEVGRGMGLTLARHGAQCLKGELQLFPVSSGGTEARLTLPLESLPTEEI